MNVCSCYQGVESKAYIEDPVKLHSSRWDSSCEVLLGRMLLFAPHDDVQHNTNKGCNNAYDGYPYAYYSVPQSQNERA